MEWEAFRVEGGKCPHESQEDLCPDLSSGELLSVWITLLMPLGLVMAAPPNGLLCDLHLQRSTSPLPHPRGATMKTKRLNWLSGFHSGILAMEPCVYMNLIVHKTSQAQTKEKPLSFMWWPEP